MSTILESIDGSVKSLTAAKKRYLDLRDLLEPHVTQIEGVVEAHGARCMAISECIVVSMPLKSFRDCLPLLEDLEIALKCDFDTTRDTDAYRIYTCSATPWIRVDGEVSIDDGTDKTLKCKRVPTGKFNTYPEYKLVCEE
jgi:hypothetical protein